MAVFSPQARHQRYDVVIVGGAIMGSSAAWWLTQLGFDGSVLVIERDPSYANSATAHTNSCIRQQFSTELNVRISQFGAEFINTFRDHMGGDERVPALSIQNYGYLYLAADEARAASLRAAAAVQHACDTPTRLMTPAEIAGDYPFFALDDIVLGSINTRNEGYWDGGTVFDWFRRVAMDRGVEYIHGEVAEISRDADRITGVTLANGTQITCGHLVNATGPRGAATAAMAGIDLPVEPRKRFTWIFEAEETLSRDLPLTIDPSGVHVRQDGPKTYLAGATPDPDPAVDADDFAMDHDLWLERIWPTLATRVPAFERIRVITEWAGHYDFNTLDQNAIIGPDPTVANFHFMNGFSGHGLQQSPAMGRGVAEQIIFGEYRTLDLSPLGYARVLAGDPFVEQAVI